MSQPAAIHLAWLDKVVAMLHTKTTRKETTAAFFEVNLAKASSEGWIAASKFGLAKVRIYDLLHVAIDIAVDLVFEDGSRPRLGEFEARLGNSHFMPRAPDDFSIGAKVAFFLQGENSPAFVRIFAELDKDESKVVKLQVDRSLIKVASEPTMPKR